MVEFDPPGGWIAVHCISGGEKDLGGSYDYETQRQERGGKKKVN